MIIWPQHELDSWKNDLRETFYVTRTGSKAGWTLLSWCRLSGTQMLMFPTPRGCQAVEHPRARGCLGDCHVAPPGELDRPQGGGLPEETQRCASQGTLSDTSIRSCPVPKCSPRIPCSQRQPVVWLLGKCFPHRATQGVPPGDVVAAGHPLLSFWVSLSPGL